MNKKTNLIWMDLEMTGLDPENDVIIEMALIATDCNLNILEEGPSVAINQPQDLLNKMDEWNTSCHSKSGLLDRVKESPITISSAEKMALDFVQKYSEPSASPLCGNSIEHDRRFIIKYMPTLNAFFHFRHINVSTIKELVLRWYPDHPKSIFEKKQAHQALLDVRESIEELQYYREHFFIALQNTNPASDSA